eukprot:180279-Karenia_brevis.AAC.1
MVLLLKSSLSAQQNIRTLKAASMTMIKIPTNNPYIEAGKKATQSWDKQTRDLKKIKDAQMVKEELGAPSVWCFNGMLTHWLENSKVEVEMKEKIKTAARGWSKELVVE